MSDKGFNFNDDENNINSWYTDKEKEQNNSNSMEKEEKKTELWEKRQINNNEVHVFDKNLNTINSPYNSDYCSRPSYVNVKKAKSTGFYVFTISTAIILAVVTIFFGTTMILGQLNKKKVPTLNANNSDINCPAINTIDRTDSGDTLTAEQIYVKVAPSIVGIITYDPSAGMISSSAAQGSGIIMSEDGYIITNAHVIGNSNKYNVTVVTSDKKEYTAKVIGFDVRTDLAVLKIDASGLTPAEFGNSDQLAVGEWVLALGNPGGLEFSNSLTRGMVSALNRSLGDANSLVKYIQTDAAINPGNSGGALLNMHGQVIGINSSKVKDCEGMGFAIPINTAKTVVDDMIKTGYVSGRVRLGITVRQISAYEAQVNNVPQGLLVVEVSNDSDAFAKGLKSGDLITKIDGVDTITTSSLYNELSKHKPGDTIKLNIYRIPLNGGSPTNLDMSISLIEDKGQLQ